MSPISERQLSTLAAPLSRHRPTLKPSKEAEISSDIMECQNAGAAMPLPHSVDANASHDEDVDRMSCSESSQSIDEMLEKSSQGAGSHPSKSSHSIDEILEDSPTDAGTHPSASSQSIYEMLEESSDDAGTHPSEPDRLPHHRDRQDTLQTYGIN